MRRVLCAFLAVALIACGLCLVVGAGDEAKAATVSVSVTAREKITLTMEDQTLNFGQLDPGTTMTSATPVTGDVRSNKTWYLTYTASGMNDAAGMPLGQLKWGVQANGSDAASLSASGTFLSTMAKTQSYNFSHYYTIEVPWTADPGAYSATVTYTATQTAP